MDFYDIMCFGLLLNFVYGFRILFTVGQHQEVLYTKIYENLCGLSV
jgi:hypothetical protein